MRSTLPVTGACIGTDMKPSASAIGSPRTTSCPACTIALAGLPACCDNGTTSIGANGIRRMGRWQVRSLNSGTCTPRQSCRFPVIRSRTPISVVLGSPLDQLRQVFLVRVQRLSGMNYLRGALLGRANQIFVRPATRVFDRGVTMLVISEDARVDVDAFVAGSTETRFDPGRASTVHRRGNRCHGRSGGFHYRRGRRAGSPVNHQHQLAGELLRKLCANTPDRLIVQLLLP